MLDSERIVISELFHVAFITAVMTQLVARLGDADFRNGKGVSLATQAERGHSRDVGLERKHHEVIDRAEIVTRLGLCNVPIGAFAIGIGNFRQRCIEPPIGPSRSNLCFANRGEVLVEASFVGRSNLLLKPPHFRKVVIKDAGFAT